MSRRGGTSGGVAFGIAVALLALPSVAAAQSAVDEYTLDIPGGGGAQSGNSGGPPAAGTAGSGSASGSGGAHSGQDTRGSGAAADSAGGRAHGDASAGADRAGAGGGGAPFQGGAAQTTDVDDRTAPEVVADTLLDGPMVPLLAALVVITGIGAWRLLRHRHTPTGAAS
jgi:hypothetical protein